MRQKITPAAAPAASKQTARVPKSLRLLDRVIDAWGGQTAFAGELKRRTGQGKLNQRHVWAWRYRSGKVPSEFAPHIEHMAAEKGIELPREVLCPAIPWFMPRARTTTTTT